MSVQKPINEDDEQDKIVNKALQKRKGRRKMAEACAERLEKLAISDTGLIGGVLGALQAPSGNRTEGYARGARRGAKTGLGMIGGGIGGAGLGALIAHLMGEDAGPGAAIGALGGLGAGGFAGYKLGGRQADPSWSSGEMDDAERNSLHTWGSLVPTLAGMGVGGAAGGMTGHPMGSLAGMGIGGLAAGLPASLLLDKHLPGNDYAQQYESQQAEKQKKKDAAQEKDAYDKLAMLVPSVTQVLQNSTYGPAAGGFKPACPTTESTDGLTDKKVSSGCRDKVAGWPGISKQALNDADLEHPAAGAGIGGLIGLLGGGAYGALRPGENEEGEQNSRLTEALKMGLLGGVGGAATGAGVGFGYDQDWGNIKDWLSEAPVRTGGAPAESAPRGRPELPTWGADLTGGRGQLERGFQPFPNSMSDAAANDFMDQLRDRGYQD
jgi:hypothetical protein